jgi:hypothetical protein
MSAPDARGLIAVDKMGDKVLFSIPSATRRLSSPLLDFSELTNYDIHQLSIQTVSRP